MGLMNKLSELIAADAPEAADDDDEDVEAALSSSGSTLILSPLDVTFFPPEVIVAEGIVNVPVL